MHQQPLSPTLACLTILPQEPAPPPSLNPLLPQGWEVLPPGVLDPELFWNLHFQTLPSLWLTSSTNLSQGKAAPSCFTLKVEALNF